MPVDHTDPTIREIFGKLDRYAEEIVALKGTIAALLTKTGFTDDDIFDWITRSAKKAVGTASAKDAQARAEFYLQETSKNRRLNRERRHPVD